MKLYIISTALCFQEEATGLVEAESQRLLFVDFGLLIGFSDNNKK